MEFNGALGELDAYCTERRGVQNQNGKLHAMIWKLNRENVDSPDKTVEIDRMKAEIRENCTRIRTLNYLINKKRLECMGIQPRVR